MYKENYFDRLCPKCKEIETLWQENKITRGSENFVFTILEFVKALEKKEEAIEFARLYLKAYIQAYCMHGEGDPDDMQPDEVFFALSCFDERFNDEKFQWEKAR